MRTYSRITYRSLSLAAVLLTLALCSRWIQADAGNCGGGAITLPFSDVTSSNIFFCSIAEAYFSGLTNGITPTTYGPSQPVAREQMAAFVTRTMDQSLKRGNRRAALQQWWTPTEAGSMRTFSLFSPYDMVSDGVDVWVTSFAAMGTVKRLRASDGVLLGTWTGANSALGIVAAAGRIFVTAQTSPGKIYVLNPDAAPGVVTIFENDIGANPVQITFDGANLWTANLSGSISRVNASSAIDSTFTAGFVAPYDILWDGSNLWVVDSGDNHVKRVDVSSGLVLESIAVGNQPRNILFDGMNIWVSNALGDSITIVRAIGNLRGTVLATLTGNGLNFPLAMAFDGERVLVCDNGNSSVSLFRASDFTPISTLSVGSGIGPPTSACSDGVNFWIGSQNNLVARF